MVRTATWNLWWRFGDWRRRRSVIEAELRSVNADVVGLQEVWFSESENLAESLAVSLGYEFAFVPSPKPERWQTAVGDDVGIGNAILSRFPIESTRWERLLSGEALDEGRVALQADITTPYGVLSFTTTQLNSGWGQSSIRSEQLATVGHLIKTHAPDGFPPVLCGDFNATADFDEIRALSGKSRPLVEGFVMLDTWEFTRPVDTGYTWDRTNPHVEATHEPNARIDYIFTGLATGAGLGRPEDTGLFGNAEVDGVWPSDHFGVGADLLVPQ